MGKSPDKCPITPYLFSWQYEQDKAKKSCGYVALYKGKRIEFYADSSYQAQQQAAEYFRARKAHEVVVMLAEKDGQPVIHTPDF